MSYLNQKTIKEPVNFSGVGLHSGNLINICVKPSDPNTGIIFKRVDLKENNMIYPNFANVSDTFTNGLRDSTLRFRSKGETAVSGDYIVGYRSNYRLRKL